MMILEGNLKDAVKYSIDMNHPILANLLTQTNTDIIRNIIKEQIDFFERQRLFDTFPDSIKNLYHLLAGNIDIINNIT